MPAGRPVLPRATPRAAPRTHAYDAWWLPSSVAGTATWPRSAGYSSHGSLRSPLDLWDLWAGRPRLRARWWRSCTFPSRRWPCRWRRPSATTATTSIWRRRSCDSRGCSSTYCIATAPRPTSLDIGRAQRDRTRSTSLEIGRTVFRRAPRPSSSRAMGLPVGQYHNVPLPRLPRSSLATCLAWRCRARHARDAPVVDRAPRLVISHRECRQDLRQSQPPPNWARRLRRQCHRRRNESSATRTRASPHCCNALMFRLRV